MNVLTTKKTLIASACMTLALFVASCEDKGNEWEQPSQVIKRTEQAYAQSFESYFGKIPANQSWDFSNTNTKATRAEAERLAATAKTYTDYCKVGGYYDVPNDFKDWLDENMHESVDNRAKGTALNFTMPSDGKFDLIPMYQGEAVSCWEMHMIVTPKNGKPIDMNFWKRNDNIEIMQKPLTWSDAAMRIKNDKCGKYLYVNPDGTIITHNHYVFNTTKGSAYYNNQLCLKLQDGKTFKKGDIVQLAFRYKVKNNTNISFDFHNSVGSAEETKPGVGFSDNVVVKETVKTDWGGEQKFSATYTKNIGFLSNQSNNDLAIFDFEVPDAADGYQYLGINLDYFDNETTSATENEFTFEGFFIQPNYTGGNIIDIDGSMARVNNGNYYTFNKTVYPATGTSGVSIIDPVQEFVHERQWDNSFNPYTKTNEYGFRFTVVIINNKKYLYAFTDDPAHKGGFISTNSENKVIFVPYSDFGKNDQPRELTYYNEPFCNKKVGDDVQFLMIGTKVIYVNNSGNLAAQELSSLRDNTYTGTVVNNRIWYLQDAKREDMMNPENGYTWTFEVDVDSNNSKRHTREFYRIGCYGDGTVNKSDDITSIYADYGGTTEDWMNVNYTIRENSMNRTAVRGKRYQFDFSKELETYKDASISFYWETMIPWERRTHKVGGKEIGRYLYSDNPNQLQMLAITARQAPADGNKNVVAVGCEAGMAIYDWDTDWDYNDVVFLLSSEKPITYIDRDGDDEIIQKRYMVEDLGSTDDIDFNDMVVDVIQTTTKKITEKTQDGKVISTTITPGETTQKVIVRAVGGTLNFDFYIGDKKIFEKGELTTNDNYHSKVNVAGMYNTGCGEGSTSADNNIGLGSNSSYIDYDGNYGEFNITEIAGSNVWNPETNNVMFRVYKKATGTKDDGVTDGYYTHDITFPELGETPHIIAFPVDKLWRNERRICCWDWINDLEPSLWNVPENKIEYEKENEKENDYSTHTETFKTWYTKSGNPTSLDEWVEKFGDNAVKKINEWLKKKGYKE